MQSSIQRVVSDGTLQFIDLAIEYIDKVNVKVSVNDVPIGAPGSGTPYTYEWITAVRIKITPVVPLAGIVTLRRVTPTLKMYHVYDDGATFNDFTMDENFKQLLFIGQEAIDGGVATDFYSDMNIHGYRIKSSADGVDPTDLVTVRQYQADASGAYASRVDAAASKVAAAASASSAATSASASASSASSASASAASATSSASSAASSASGAASSASSASASASAAASSYDSFDDRYLGSKAVEPTVDNDGAALITGCLYWNSVSNEMRAWSGSAWRTAYNPAGGDVVGPASAVADSVAIYSGTTGKVLKGGPLITVGSVDTTVGRLLKVGDFGLGSANAPAVTDANAITITGVHSLETPFTNGPIAAPVVLHTQSYSGAKAQTAVEVGSSNNRMWFRQYTGVAWLAWAEVWTGANLVKTTSSTDTTAGSMLKVGDFGVGTPIPTTNLNTLTGTGLFSCADVTGTPSTSYLGWWVYQIDAGAGLWKNQTAWQQGNPSAQYVRSSVDGTTWNAWIPVVFNNNPALKAQDGYVALPNGVIIQWADLPSGTTSLAFPIAFPTLCASVAIGQNGAASGSVNRVGISAMSTTTLTLQAAVTSGAVPARYIAIGY